MTKSNDLKSLSLTELRNAHLKETQEFLYALEKESFEELAIRRHRIKEIDEEILNRNQPE